MATANKFQDFAEQLGRGAHQLHAAGHELRVYLTNNTPDAALDAVKGDLAGITEEGGYTEAAGDTQNDYTESGGTGTLTCVDVVWTGSGSGFGPHRYTVLCNITQTSPLSPLIVWWDYGSSISTLAGETFTVDFGASVGTIS